jgi:sugar lactone lactonase YvrE
MALGGTGRRRERLRATPLAAAALALLVGAAPRPPERAPERGAERAPEVRRTAVIEGRSGERFLRGPLAIARDAKTGELVVSSFESGEVVILDPSGAVVARIGGDAGLVTPYGVAFDAAGRIYVSEVRTGRVKVLGSGGAAVDELDLSEIAGRPVSPGRITFGEDGHLYVADLSGNELLVLSANGDLLRGIGPFPYLQKGGLARAGRLMGLSGRGSAVTVFDAAGAKVRSFGEHGEAYERTVSFPTGFAVDAKDRIWIVDAFQHRIKVFSLGGKFLFNVGAPEGTGSPISFFFPVDLCFGAPGELIVLEKGSERIQTFLVADLVEGAR